VQILNTDWLIAIDPTNSGKSNRWFERIAPGAERAPAPGIIQQVFPAYHGVAWYWNRFAPARAAQPGERILIHFGAVDYLGEVWVNGHYFGLREGGEIPFEVDITEALANAGENLLAVRVLNPTNDPIDGYTLKETPHRCRTIPPRPGSAYNLGGILYPPALRMAPALFIADLVARPDPHTGHLSVIVTVRNCQARLGRGSLALSVAPASSGSAGHTDAVARVATEIEVEPGELEVTLTLTVPQPRLWELDDPYLYRVTAVLHGDQGEAHRQDVRCGFRELRVQDGYFHLNGRRIFIRSSHTLNAMPVGQQAPVIPDFVRRDLIYAKAAGFNAIRFIAGMGYPEQLDFCDELGLLVWESTLAGWLLADSPRMGERFDRNTLGMIRRDRNHPSVAIWELLNETGGGPVFRHAVGLLPKLRELDPTRVVLLNSGRFDQDWSIGSVSNPGSSEWEPLWGCEGEVDAPGKQAGLYAYIAGAGDAHYYPRAPQTDEENARIRAIGRDTKPVLLSEYGMGSLFDVIGEARHFEMAARQGWARPDVEDAASVAEQSRLLQADWERLGFEGVYPFAEDLLRESQRLHAQHRRLGFDLIRSNPQLCGYNLTGTLDHVMSGEGLWTMWREMKLAAFDALRDGWSPLRWCLFVNPQHSYSGEEVQLEAVLANDGALPPGNYAARFRICGPAGIEWERSVEFWIPEECPFALPVLTEVVVLQGPSGQYVFAASLEAGGHAHDGRQRFHLSDRATLPRLAGTAALFGIDRRTEKWLVARGLQCANLREVPGPGGLILIGDPPGPETDGEGWAELARRLNQGATLLFLSAAPFVDHPAALAWLPESVRGQAPRCYRFDDWLYHKECVANRRPVFDALPPAGIMEWDYYGPVIPSEIFTGLATPDETVAAAFATGHQLLPAGYECGLLVAAYQVGEGRLILNTLRVVEHLGAHPAAERLGVNLLTYALPGAGAAV
jgi:hypothetical protein